MAHGRAENAPFLLAGTLAERSRGAAAISAVDPARLAERLALWCDTRTLTAGRPVDFTRWQRLGLDAARLHRVLGETLPSLSARTVAPAWTRQLDRAARASCPPARWGGFALPDPRRLLTPFLPLVGSAVEQLRERLRALPGGTSLGPAELTLLTTPPWTPLIVMCARPVVLEFRIWRAGRPPTQQSFSAFLDMVPERQLWRLYPTLTRCLVEELLRWSARSVEFTLRFLADRTALRETLHVAGRLVSIDWAAGDPHNEGRRVAIVGLSSGARIVYKPRPTGVDAAFHDLVAFLSARGPYRLAAAAVLDRGGYGWAEFITADPCPGGAEAVFFERQGALLALLHALGSNDMHYENLVAAGAVPVCVDLETVLQPAPRAAVAELGRALGLELARSVLATGILPTRMIRTDADGVRTFELGALNGGREQEGLVTLPVVAGLAADAPRIVRRRPTVPAAHNALRSASGVIVPPAPYLESVLRGFHREYRFLQTLDPEPLLARFRGVRLRFVLRPTMVYSRLLAESWHPDLLQDGLERSLFLELIAGTPPEAPDRLVQAEVDALAHNDVPCFTLHSNERHLRDGRGVLLLRDYFELSPCDAVRGNFAALSTAQLRRQEWLIRAAFASATEPSRAPDPLHPRRAPHPGPAPGAATADTVRAECHAAVAHLATTLAETAIRGGDGGLGWLTLNLVQDRYWTIGASGADLFGGAAGIAIFLAQAGQYLLRPELIDAALRHRAFLAAAVRSVPPGGVRPGDYSLGAYGEFGATVLLDLSLNLILRRQEFHPAAELLETVSGLIEHDLQLDLIGGSAGTLAVCELFQTLWPAPDVAQLARQAAARLLSTQWDTGGQRVWTPASTGGLALAGFSHGQTGIALALARHGANPLTDPRVRAAVRPAIAAAWAFEDQHYSRRRGNWRDLRAPADTAGAYMSAWCHGSPGILLGRRDTEASSGLAPTAATTHAVAHLQAAGGLQRTLPALHNGSLCHGDLGNLLALLRAGVIGPEEPSLLRCLRRVAAAVRRDAPQSGVPLAVNVPGVMTGLAGIGLGLLSVLDPQPGLNVLDLSVRPSPRREP